MSATPATNEVTPIRLINLVFQSAIFIMTCRVLDDFS